jgi:hypothetical protein
MTCSTCGGTGFVVSGNQGKRCPTCNTVASTPFSRRQGNLERGFRSAIPNPADLPQAEEMTPEQLEADLLTRFGNMTRNR